MIYYWGMRNVHFIEAPCKSALNRVEGMPFQWSLNPYRGCVHGCHYCYARATHPYLGFNPDDEFETRIVVKTSMPEVLRRELGKGSWKQERVALGTATDAYQPCEGRYRLARRILEALRDFDTPVSVVTKSTLVWRDRDLLIALAELPGTRVNFSITTLDRDLWRQLEPGTPPPAQRLGMMQRLAECGVPCAVFLAPVLPGLTDSEASMAAVAAAAREHGATAFWAGPLRLAPKVKEHYFRFVAEHHPHLAPRYARAYAGANAPVDYRAVLEKRISRIRDRHGFREVHDGARADGPDAAGADQARKTRGQLSLPF